jgi:hypothetical protein
VEKEMREQTEQQNKKLREIKERTAAIRKRYEEQQKRTSGFGSMFFSPETYGQGLILPLVLRTQVLYSILYNYSGYS